MISEPSTAQLRELAIQTSDSLEPEEREFMRELNTNTIHSYILLYKYIIYINKLLNLLFYIKLIIIIIIIINYIMLVISFDNKTICNFILLYSVFY